MCLRVSYKKKINEKIFLASLKSLQKGVGSGSISQRHGTADPDPHQNVTDPQHWKKGDLLHLLSFMIHSYSLCLYGWLWIQKTNMSYFHQTIFMQPWHSAICCTLITDSAGVLFSLIKLEYWNPRLGIGIGITRCCIIVLSTELKVKYRQYFLLVFTVILLTITHHS
jgi:hypothetical protein